MSHAGTIKRWTGRDAPSTVREAEAWLNELGSDQDPIGLTRFQVHSLESIDVRDLAGREGYGCSDPAKVRIWFYGDHPLRIIHASVLRMIVDRLQTRRQKWRTRPRKCPTCPRPYQTVR